MQALDNGTDKFIKNETWQSIVQDILYIEAGLESESDQQKREFINRICSELAYAKLELDVPPWDGEASATAVGAYKETLKRLGKTILKRAPQKGLLLAIAKCVDDARTKAAQEAEKRKADADAEAAEKRKADADAEAAKAGFGTLR